MHVIVSGVLSMARFLDHLRLILGARPFIDLLTLDGLGFELVWSLVI